MPNRQRALALAMAIGEGKAKKKKLDYPRTANSPYPAGSAEDRSLSAASQARSAKNRAALAEGVKDVVSGRALAQGVRVVSGAALSAARKGFEAIDKRVLPASYKRDKRNTNRMAQPDVQRETKRQMDKKEKLRRKLR